MERPEAFLGGFDLTPLISYYTRGFFSAEKKVQGLLTALGSPRVSGRLRDIYRNHWFELSKGFSCFSHNAIDAKETPLTGTGQSHLKGEKTKICRTMRIER